MAYRLGVDAKLYWKTGGHTSGSWNLVTRARDVTVNLEMEDADLTSRLSQGWRQRVPALKVLGVDFDLVWDTSDPAFNAIKDAYLNRSMISFKILDDVESTGQGPRGDFLISSFSRNEPLAEGLTVSVTATVMYSDDPPVWET